MADVRRDPAQRPARPGPGLVRGAQRPAGAALLERGAVPAVRHPRLRQQFHLGFAEPDLRRPRRRHPGHDHVQVSAGLPAGSGDPARHRSFPGGVGADARSVAAPGVPAGHPAAAAPDPGRHRTTGGAAHAGGVRRAVDPALPDLHHSHLPGVRTGVQQRHRGDALLGTPGTVLPAALAGVAHARPRPPGTHRPGQRAAGRTGPPGAWQVAAPGAAGDAGAGRYRYPPGDARLLAVRRLLGQLPADGNRLDPAFLPVAGLRRGPAQLPAGAAGKHPGGALPRRPGALDPAPAVPAASVAGTGDRTLAGVLLAALPASHLPDHRLAAGRLCPAVHAADPGTDPRGPGKGLAAVGGSRPHSRPDALDGLPADHPADHLAGHRRRLRAGVPRHHEGTDRHPGARSHRAVDPGHLGLGAHRQPGVRCRRTLRRAADPDLRLAGVPADHPFVIGRIEQGEGLPRLGGLAHLRIVRGGEGNAALHQRLHRLGA